jgi:hypothetical protein
VVLLLEAERRGRGWLFLAAGVVAALSEITRAAVLLLPIAVVWVLSMCRLLAGSERPPSVQDRPKDECLV